MWWRRNRRDRHAEERLAFEAAAYLTGDITAVGRRAPAWVMMSRIAHADLSRMAATAAGRPAADPGSWQAGVAYLASEILSLAADEESLRRLQREALLPLELDLLRGAVAQPVSTSAFIDLVCGALQDYRVRRSA